MTFENMVPGNYQFQIEHGKYNNLKSSFTIREGRLDTLKISLFPKKHSAGILFSALIPGAGQYYSEAKIRGTGIFVLQFATLYLSYNYATAHRNKAAEYREVETEYLTSISLTDVQNTWTEMNRKYDEVENLKNLRDGFFIAAGLVYLVNIIDIVFIEKFPSPLQNTEMGINYNPNTDNTKIAATINF